MKKSARNSVTVGTCSDTALEEVPRTDNLRKRVEEASQHATEKSKLQVRHSCHVFAITLCAFLMCCVGRHVGVVFPCALVRLCARVVVRFCGCLLGVLGLFSCCELVRSSEPPSMSAAHHGWCGSLKSGVLRVWPDEAVQGHDEAH